MRFCFTSEIDDLHQICTRFFNFTFSRMREVLICFLYRTFCICSTFRFTSFSLVFSCRIQIKNSGNFSPVFFYRAGKKSMFNFLLIFFCRIGKKSPANFFPYLFLTKPKENRAQLLAHLFLYDPNRKLRSTSCVSFSVRFVQKSMFNFLLVFFCRN